MKFRSKIFARTKNEICQISFALLLHNTVKTHMGEVLDVLGKMQCGIVCKGKRYYLPIPVGDYDGKLLISY